MFNVSTPETDKTGHAGGWTGSDTDQDLMAVVGLTECEPTPKIIAFCDDDPLGARSISRDLSSSQPNTGQRSNDEALRTKRTLGEQATILSSAHDRALALRRITVAAAMHLSREIVLGMISMLCSCSSLSAISYGLRVLGLNDVKLLVNLMRLVAAGRAHSLNTSGNPRVPVSSAADLKMLSQAVSALISNDREAARLLLEVSVRDLMDSATGQFTQDPYAPLTT